jgi:hypothetical protein
VETMCKLETQGIDFKRLSAFTEDEITKIFEAKPEDAKKLLRTM